MIDLTADFAPDVAHRLALHKRAEIDFQRLLDRDDAELPDLPPPPPPKPYVPHKFTLKEAFQIISCACNPVKYLP